MKQARVKDVMQDRRENAFWICTFGILSALLRTKERFKKHLWTRPITVNDTRLKPNMITHFLHWKQNSQLGWIVRVLLSWVHWDKRKKNNNYTLTSTAPASKYLTIAKEQPCDCYFNPHTLLWQMMFFKLNLKIDLLLLWTPAALFKVSVVSVVFYDNPISDEDIKTRTPFCLTCT